MSTENPTRSRSAVAVLREKVAKWATAARRDRPLGERRRPVTEATRRGGEQIVEASQKGSRV